MATVRIGDFSGGTSEVLDPSLIAPNAAVASYNLDPRTGVFSPVFGLNYIGRSGSSFLDFIEYDAGHEGLMAPQPRCYVRWGDYLLWSYPNTGLTASAAKFNSVTAERTEFRELGLQPTTAAENASVSLDPIRAAALTFGASLNAIPQDIRLNISVGLSDPTRQYQRVAIYRETMTLTGTTTDGAINIGPGDYVVLFPPLDQTGAQTILCGIPGVVVDVLYNGILDPPGTGDAYPQATVVVSRYGSPEKMVAPGSSFGVDGFAEVTGNTPVFPVGGQSAILFKRDTKTFDEIQTIARRIRSRGGNYVPASAAVRRTIANSSGGQYFAKSGAGTFSIPAYYLEAFLYDYEIRRNGDTDVVLVRENTFVFGNGTPQAENPIATKYDLVHYWDDSPDAPEQDGKAILGLLVSGQAVGLDAGVYKYAMTRVDDWGRESAPWP
ncbi:MAG: hypothetical protein KC488_13475, partial [Candidatus Cloacimonetes bacterium]|nr:hypothetical protein [Candidatus Cloacimonadota bacterium]